MHFEFVLAWLLVTSEFAEPQARTPIYFHATATEKAQENAE